MILMTLVLNSKLVTALIISILIYISCLFGERSHAKEAKKPHRNHNQK